MTSKQKVRKVEGMKVASITILSIVTILIVLLGVGFCIYSSLYDVSFHVLNADIPGYIWGAVVAFLGIRYLLAVRKLKPLVYSDKSKFSWDNFKSDKHKTPTKHESEPMLSKHWMRG